MSCSREYKLGEIIDESIVDLKKATMALQEFVDEYDWDVEPTADKAKKFILHTDARKCPKDEEISWKLLAEYDKIKWLVHVALDYCWNASEILQKEPE